MARQINGLDPVNLVQRVLDSRQIHGFIEKHKPQDEFYHRLKAALATYRGNQTAGGWVPVPDGPVLKMGMEDARVPAIRRRLVLSGDLPKTASSNSMAYDGALSQAVAQFQGRHGLSTDGMTGRNTLAAMNVPVESRINQIRVNLERARWILHEAAVLRRARGND
jgi:murein L,D-transpeptidase YcbB/YkuD